MGFKRQREDFRCVVCGAFNRGDGYTNHCARCLTSLHVDVDPGDREHQCRGIMRPVSVDTAGGTYVVTHRCEKCNEVKRCKVGPRDSSDAVAEVMRQAAEAVVREGRAWGDPRR